MFEIDWVFVGVVCSLTIVPAFFMTVLFLTLTEN
jgi:hypothetical protein